MKFFKGTAESVRGVERRDAEPATAAVRCEGFVARLSLRLFDSADKGASCPSCLSFPSCFSDRAFAERSKVRFSESESDGLAAPVSVRLSEKEEGFEELSARFSTIGFATPGSARFSIDDCVGIDGARFSSREAKRARGFGRSARLSVTDSTGFAALASGDLETPPSARFSVSDGDVLSLLVAAPERLSAMGGFGVWSGGALATVKAGVSGGLEGAASFSGGFTRRGFNREGVVRGRGIMWMETCLN